jgi:enamine deaminase RidA (YjgF/YER057c/UK114 family)
MAKKLFSQILEVAPGSRLLVVSGQTAVDGEGRPVAAGDFPGQFELAFANLAAVLAGADAKLSDIVKTTTFLVGAANVAEYYAVRPTFFPDWFPDGLFPTNTLVVVERLAEPEFLIEIEALAAVPERR